MSIPGWTDYTAEVGTANAAELDRQLGPINGAGLRVMDLGDGRVALDDEAVSQLIKQGGASDDEQGLLIWAPSGDSFPLLPAGE